MKLIEKFSGVQAKQSAASRPPCGAGFSEKIVSKTETLEVHGSEINDPGPDYCEFRAIDAEGNIIGTKRVNGY